MSVLSFDDLMATLDSPPPGESDDGTLTFDELMQQYAPVVAPPTVEPPALQAPLPDEAAQPEEVPPPQMTTPEEMLALADSQAPPPPPPPRPDDYVPPEAGYAPPPPEAPPEPEPARERKLLTPVPEAAPLDPDAAPFPIAPPQESTPEYSRWAVEKNIWDRHERTRLQMDDERAVNYDKWITSAQKRAEKGDFDEDWVEWTLGKVPLVGTAMVLNNYEELANSLRRIDAGYATERDFNVVMGLTQQQKNIDERGWGQIVFNLAAEIPGFMAGFAASGGMTSAVGLGTKAGAQAALKVGIKKMMAKHMKKRGFDKLGRAGFKAAGAVSKLGGAAINAAPRAVFMPDMVVESTVQRMGDKLDPEILKVDRWDSTPPTETEDGITGGRAYIETREKGEDFAAALVKGFGDTYVEAFSEMSGESIGDVLGIIGKKLGAKGAAKKVKDAVTKALKLDGATVQHIDDVFKVGGFDGLIEEVGEERFGEILRGVIGIEDDYGATGDVLSGDLERMKRGLYQISTEFGGFAAPAIARTGAAIVRKLVGDQPADAPPGPPGPPGPPSDPSAPDLPGPGYPKPSATDQVAAEKIATNVLKDVGVEPGDVASPEDVEAQEYADDVLQMIKDQPYALPDDVKEAWETLSNPANERPLTPEEFAEDLQHVRPQTAEDWKTYVSERLVPGSQPPTRPLSPEELPMPKGPSLRENLAGRASEQEAVAAQQRSDAAADASQAPFDITYETGETVQYTHPSTGKAVTGKVRRDEGESVSIRVKGRGGNELLKIPKDQIITEAAPPAPVTDTVTPSEKSGITGKGRVKIPIKPGKWQEAARIVENDINTLPVDDAIDQLDNAEKFIRQDQEIDEEEKKLLLAKISGRRKGLEKDQAHKQAAAAEGRQFFDINGWKADDFGDEGFGHVMAGDALVAVAVDGDGRLDPAYNVDDVGIFVNRGPGQAARVRLQNQGGMAPLVFSESKLDDLGIKVEKDAEGVIKQRVPLDALTTKAKRRAVDVIFNEMDVQGREINEGVIDNVAKALDLPASEVKARVHPSKPGKRPGKVPQAKPTVPEIQPATFTEEQLGDIELQAEDDPRGEQVEEEDEAGGIEEILSPGLRRQRSREIIEAGTYKVGDRVILPGGSTATIEESVGERPNNLTARLEDGTLVFPLAYDVKKAPQKRPGKVPQAKPTVPEIQPYNRVLSKEERKYLNDAGYDDAEIRASSLDALRDKMRADKGELRTKRGVDKNPADGKRHIADVVSRWTGDMDAAGAVDEIVRHEETRWGPQYYGQYLKAANDGKGMTLKEAVVEAIDKPKRFQTGDAKEIAAKLPPITEGSVRLTHFFGNPNTVSNVVEGGQDFNYGKRGDVGGSTDAFQTPEEVADVIARGKTGAFTRGDFGPFVLLMDVPFAEHKTHSLSPTRSGSIPNKYVVGVYDTSTGEFRPVKETIEEPEGVSYASGLSRSPTEIRAHIAEGKPVGVSVWLGLSETVRTELVNYANSGGKVFIDSGSYSAFKKKQQVDWAKALFRYGELVNHVDRDKRHNVSLVAPDVIGDPEANEKLLRGPFRKEFEKFFDSGVTIIMPVQKGRGGEQTISTQLADLTDYYPEELNEEYTLGIPFNAAAWNEDEVVQLLKDMGSKHGVKHPIHLLGGGVPKVQSLMARVEEEGITHWGIAGDAETKEISERRRGKKKLGKVGATGPKWFRKIMKAAELPKIGSKKKTKFEVAKRAMEDYGVKGIGSWDRLARELAELKAGIPQTLDRLREGPITYQDLDDLLADHPRAVYEAVHVLHQKGVIALLDGAEGTTKRGKPNRAYILPEAELARMLQDKYDASEGQVEKAIEQVNADIGEEFWGVSEKKTPRRAFLFRDYLDPAKWTKKGRQILLAPELTEDEIAAKIEEAFAAQEEAGKLPEEKKPVKRPGNRKKTQTPEQKAASLKKRIATLKRNGTLDDSDVKLLEDKLDADLGSVGGVFNEAERRAAEHNVKQQEDRDQFTTVFGRNSDKLVARARRSEGDAAGVKNFDVQVAPLRDDPSIAPTIYGLADRLGDGDIENGLWEVLKGGVAQFKLKKADDFLPDVMEEARAGLKDEPYEETEGDTDFQFGANVKDEPIKPGGKTKLGDAAQKARGEAKDSLQDLRDALGEEGFFGSTPINPKIVSAVARSVAKSIKAGVLTFAEFLETVINEFGVTMTRKIRSELEQGWTFAGGIVGDGVLDKANPTVTSQLMLASWVEGKLNENDEAIGSPDFFQAANEMFGGTRSEGKYGDSEAYDALELGVNKYIRNTLAIQPTGTAEQAKESIAILEKLGKRLPKHKTRTGEKDTLQQFSTPPAYGFLAAWALNLSENSVVLEPSAGMGGLAVHAINSGADVYTNEIDKARAGPLSALSPEKVFTEDAEQIAAILPDQMPPITDAIMNPPFSRAGRRMGNKIQTGTDRKHIDQVLKLLPDGGRVSAIVGAGLHGRGKGFDNWLADLPYAVVADVEIGRDVYKGYGTTFPTRLLVIDKKPGDNVDRVTGSVATLAEAVDLLEGVRNARSERISDKGTEEVPGSEGTASRPGTPTGVVGTSQPAEPGAVPSEPVSGTASGTTPATGRPGGTTGTGSPGGSGTSVRRPGGRRPGRRGQPSTTGDTSGREPVRKPAGEDTEPTSTRGKLDVKPLKVSAAEKTTVGILDDSTYQPYQPSVIVEGSTTHPASLVESAAMAAISSPKPTYAPRINQETVKGYVTEGGVHVGISDIQLEAVVNAGQAHEQMLPDGKRRGFMIGDGTGVGKAREIAGIIQDNFNRGRTKAVWVSKNDKLLKPAKEEWEKVGGHHKEVFPHNKSTKSGASIDKSDGILFTTYSTLRTTASTQAIAAGNVLSRVDQIVEWFGEDYDGVIVFDEAHQMQSGITSGTGLSRKEASSQALAGIDLQDRLPLARIVYLSATSATEVSNLAYATRLGLWGEDTAFETRDKFIAAIAAGGVGAMEQTAGDMKAMGMYLARNISFNDGTKKGKVEYERLEHKLTPSQTTAYSKMADAWQVVYTNIEEALGTTGQTGRAASQARSQFRAAQLRFGNSVITSMQTPVVIQAIEADMAAGRSSIVQLTNTNEAALTRAIGRQAGEETEEDLEALDLSPGYILMDYLERSFPTQQYETYIDANGNERTRPVVDSQGKPVHNPEAVAAKERLLDELSGAMESAGQGALDMIIEHFGADNVAEITGRSERLVHDKDGKLIRQKRKPANLESDANDFMDGEKRILIFSEAGGTGASYHADLSRKNQQKRHHYLLQAGWRADVAIQGLGRSHRSNQAQAPKFFLIQTNLKGQKRFISTIARRLGQLGALTKGERKAGESGVFSAADNLESTEARAALASLFHAMLRGETGAYDMEFLNTRMGLKLLNEDGTVKAQWPTIQQFLNRVLTLGVEQQNEFYEMFDQRVIAHTEAAIEGGTLDQGMETVKADSITKVSEEVVYTHETGSETKHVVMSVGKKTKPVGWEEMLEATADRNNGYVRSAKTGRVAIIRGTGVTDQDRHGNMTERLKLLYPTSYSYSTAAKLEGDNWTRVDEKVARKNWGEQVANTPAMQHEEMHIISGVLLPIWNKLPATHPQVRRLLTDDGEHILGRHIDEDDVYEVLTRLGVAVDAPQLTPQEAFTLIFDDGGSITLANDWQIKRVRAEGETSIEIVGPTAEDFDPLETKGAFRRRIDYRVRHFVPTDESGVRVLEQLINDNAIIGVRRGSRRSTDQDQPAATTPTPRPPIRPGRKAKGARREPDLAGAMESLEAAGEADRIPMKGYGPVGAARKKPKDFSAPSSTPGVMGKVIPIEEDVGRLRAVQQEVLKAINPPKVSKISETAEQINREAFARTSQAKTALFHELRKYRRYMRKLNRKQVVDFIDAVEHGPKEVAKLKDKKLRELAVVFREMLDDLRGRVQKLGYLSKFDEYYFPHAWKLGQQDKAREFMGQARAPLSGSKAFLKKRTIPTFREGVEQRQLEPVSWNPVDMVYSKAGEILKFLEANAIIEGHGRAGLTQFVYEKSKPPADWVKINDPLFTIFAKPWVEVDEHFDALLIEQLDSFATSIGVSHERLMKLPGGALGQASRDGKITTKFGSTEGTYIHELGHQLGYKYNLFEWMLQQKEGSYRTITKGPRAGQQEFREERSSIDNRKKIKEQWRALALARLDAEKDVTDSRRRYILKEAEKEAVLLEAYIHAPDLMKKIAPDVHTLYEKFLNAHSELKPLLGIRPSLTRGTSTGQVPVPGVTTLGHYYMPENAARLLNNHLSPGFWQHPHAGVRGAYGATRAVGNSVNQAQLFSLFHATFATISTPATYTGQALRNLSTFQPRMMVKGIGQLALAATVVGPMLKLATSGAELRKKGFHKRAEQITDKYIAKMVEAAAVGGFHAEADAFYFNQSPDRISKLLETMLNDPSLAKTVGSAVRLPFTTISAALEAGMKPMMQHYVPALKAGMFQMLVEDEMERLGTQDLSDATLKRMLTKATDSVDNRLGQLPYDNLFWNRYLKDLAMISTRAVGWNLGFIREYVIGPVYDLATTKQRLAEGDAVVSLRMGEFFGSVFYIGAVGAILQYVMTGVPPEELKDYYFPKTGGTRPDGSPARLSLPDYARDYISYLTRPLTTLQHKTHPLIGIMSELAHNQDYFGNEIKNEDDPWVQQFKDTAEHVGKALLPFSVKQYEEYRKDNVAPVKAAVLSTFGIGVAPGYISKSSAQILMGQMLAERRMEGSRDKQAKERSELRREAIKRMREHRSLVDLNLYDTFNEDAMKRMRREASRPWFTVNFERLTTQEAFNVYMIATDKERNESALLLAKKFFQHESDHTDRSQDDWRAMSDIFRELWPDLRQRAKREDSDKFLDVLYDVSKVVASEMGHPRKIKGESDSEYAGRVEDFIAWHNQLSRFITELSGYAPLRDALRKGSFKRKLSPRKGETHQDYRDRVDRTKVRWRE